MTKENYNGQFKCKDLMDNTKILTFNNEKWECKCHDNVLG